jgi:hypothetical protein
MTLSCSSDGFIDDLSDRAIAGQSRPRAGREPIQPTESLRVHPDSLDYLSFTFVALVRPPTVHVRHQCKTIAARDSEPERLEDQLQFRANAALNDRSRTCRVCQIAARFAVIRGSDLAADFTAEKSRPATFDSSFGSASVHHITAVAEQVVPKSIPSAWPQVVLSRSLFQGRVKVPLQLNGDPSPEST